jgi:hypothetical protein
MQAAVSLNFTSLHEAAALRPWGAHNDYCGKLHSGRLRTDPKHLAVPGTKSAHQMHLVRKTSFAPVSHIASESCWICSMSLTYPGIRDHSELGIKAVSAPLPVYLIADHTPFLPPRGETGNHRFFQSFTEFSSFSMNIAC